jgi:hypothetical protein
MTLANLAFVAMLTAGMCLAVVGALLWDSINHRSYLRQTDPDLTVRARGRWM